MTVDEMLHRMSSREFASWMVYSDIEPFGEGRMDHRIGILAALLANIHRDKEKKATAFEPADFFPEPDLSSFLEDQPDPNDPNYSPSEHGQVVDVAAKIRAAFSQPPGFRSGK